MTDISNINFNIILDFLETFAFAISGIRLASGKNLIYFVPTFDGETTREILFDNCSINRY